MTDFKVKGKTVIGLTGSIASGKSAAAAIFKKLGAQVLSADELSAKHFVLNMPQIQSYFGTTDKQKIAAAVFASADKKLWLEKLLHPSILADAAQSIKESQNKIIVFDVPLLFESGLQTGFDLTVCITAPYDVRLKRAIARGLKEGDFKSRDSAQMPQEEKIKRAAAVFENNAALEDLEVKITKFYSGLKK